jgi:hypothetical protein
MTPVPPSKSYDEIYAAAAFWPRGAPDIDLPVKFFVQCLDDDHQAVSFIKICGNTFPHKALWADMTTFERKSKPMSAHKALCGYVSAYFYETWKLVVTVQRLHEELNGDTLPWVCGRRASGPARRRCVHVVLGGCRWNRGD